MTDDDLVADDVAEGCVEGVRECDDESDATTEVDTDKGTYVSVRERLEETVCVRARVPLSRELVSVAVNSSDGACVLVGTNDTV